MKFAEKFFIALAFTGIIMTVTGLNTGIIVSAIALLGLSSLYFYFGFALFNGIPFRAVLKRASYRGVTGKDLLTGAAAGFMLPLLVIGFLFVVQRWPGAIVLTIVGFILCMGMALFAGAKMLQGHSVLHQRILARALPLLIVAGVAYSWYFIH